MIRLPARLIVTVLLAAGFGAAAYSAQLGSRPAEEWIRTLDGETRVSTLKIDEVVTAMRLETGQIVADIGAGTGLLSVPVAKAVGPRGRVFAVEVDEGFFPAIKKRADDHAVKNIQPVLGAFTDPKLPVKNIDLAFFHDVLHHVEDRAGYLKTLVQYLGPRARIVVVDYEGGMGPHAKQPELQVSRAQLSAWMDAAGFRQVADAKLFNDKYVLTFAKK